MSASHYSLCVKHRNIGADAALPQHQQRPRICVKRGRPTATGALTITPSHLQRAMPVLCSQHLSSYVSYFASDLERLRETVKRVNRSPLGCGALAGDGFNISRDMMAEELGFAGLF